MATKKLLVSRGSERLLVLPIPIEGTIRVGRSEECELQIPDPTVSRHQCDLEVCEDGVRLVDRSGEGTRVSGKICRTKVLSQDEQIELGGIRVGQLAEEVFYQGQTAGGLGGTSRMADGGTVEKLLLVGKKPNGEQVRLVLDDTILTFSIGRAFKNDLVLGTEFASSFHCRIFRVEGAWIVEDLCSKNGTFVNGVRISRAELRAGCILRIGPCELRLVESETREGHILTQDPRMLELLEKISNAAKSEAPVLVQGEPGTGKELVARALHEGSPRRTRPLVIVNCSAINEELAESLLFGHEKGSFTGATKAQKGKFEQADGGTIFLDEIGDLPQRIQPKILRTLQEGEIEPLGSKVRKIDVRVVAATNRPLKKMILAGQFREDLFGRLNVISIELPPLRERPGDAELIASNWIKRRCGELGRDLKFSEEALDLIRLYPWPNNNVRELQAAITRAIVSCKGTEIQPEDLALEDQGHAENWKLGAKVIESTLERCGSIRAAAAYLGVAKSSLHDRINKLGIKWTKKKAFSD